MIDEGHEDTPRKKLRTEEKIPSPNHGLHARVKMLKLFLRGP